jgi:hypothetical protein
MSVTIPPASSTRIMPAAMSRQQAALPKAVKTLAASQAKSMAAARNGVPPCRINAGSSSRNSSRPARSDGECRWRSRRRPLFRVEPESPVIEEGAAAALGDEQLFVTGL